MSLLWFGRAEFLESINWCLSPNLGSFYHDFTVLFFFFSFSKLLFLYSGPLVMCMLEFLLYILTVSWSSLVFLKFCASNQIISIALSSRWLVISFVISILPMIPFSDFFSFVILYIITHVIFLSAKFSM